MSAIVSSDQFEFAIARSEIVDCHAMVDLAIRTRLRQMGIDAKPQLAQNLSALQAIKAGPTYSKKMKAAVEAAICDLKSANNLRCDIVHGPMAFVDVWGIRHACFINVGRVTPEASNATIMSIAQMRALSKTFKRLADVILNGDPAATKISPSSPPPPSQAAIAGP
jgi:hypothetical protein